jgi:hypothetical protein
MSAKQAWRLPNTVFHCDNLVKAMSFTDVSFVTMTSFGEKSSINYNRHV